MANDETRSWWTFLSKHREVGLIGTILPILFTLFLLDKQFGYQAAEKKRIEEEKAEKFQMKNLQFINGQWQFNNGQMLQDNKWRLPQKANSDIFLKDLNDKTKPKSQEDWQHEFEKNKVK